MASGSDKEATMLWGGRFSSATSDHLQSLNSSINIDKVMWEQDVKGSIMYSKALLKAGLLSKEQQNSIENGLNIVMEEWSSGKFEIHETDEDIHTANERRLKELIGSTGGMLHTGRSRNDQVITDLRLWLKDDLHVLSDLVKDLICVLVQRAEKEETILMPGYTHLQRAQPIRWSHWLLSYAWFLFHDLQKLKTVFWSTDVSPLGSGALAGTPFNIDRSQLAESLCFGRVSQNSLMAVSDRDFVAEHLSWLSLTCCHLSRLAEDLILYSTSEFGFLDLSDEFSTGSSLMPQKKNPDSLELIRGKTGRLIGNVSGFLCILKGLPSTYNKDLQDDKELLFQSCDTMKLVLKVASGVVASLKVNKEACFKALTEDMLATDVAYFLVRRGVPFREAHGLAGRVVKKAEELNCSLSEIPLNEMMQISPEFTADVKNIWKFESSVEQYSAEGGTSLSSVRNQISKLKHQLEEYKLTDLKM